MKNEYDDKVRDAMSELFTETGLKGPNDLLNLHWSLSEYAKEVLTFRDGMTINPVFNCSECRKDWTMPITVGRARSVTPDNCPVCYNKSPNRGSESSCWTDVFKYVEEKAEH